MFTFGLVFDPGIDLIRGCTGVAEVQVPALTLKVGFVGRHERLLHGETFLAEHGVGDQHRVQVRFGREGFVQLPQHLIRPCAHKEHGISQ